MDWWMDEHNQEKIDALYDHVALLGTISGGGGDGTKDLMKIEAFYINVMGNSLTMTLMDDMKQAIMLCLRDHVWNGADRTP